MHRTTCLLALAIPAALLPVWASESEPLICFGTEPFWSLDLTQPDRARFSALDSAEREYRGSFNPLAYRKEAVWRGEATPEQGVAEASADSAARAETGVATGALVAFVRESPCSDGMSDTQHPYAVNLSLPDGRHLAGCCRVPEASEANASHGGTSAAPDQAAAGLEGRAWRLIEWPGQTLPANQGPTAAMIPRLRFAAGRLEGFSGCNQLTGSYTVEANKLVPGALAGTMMACEQPAMGLEDQFLRVLSGPLSLALGGDRLTLTPVDGGAALVFARELPPALEHSTWEVTGYNNGRQAVVSPMAGAELSLGFEQGRVSGSAGCNRFHGDFEVDGKTLSLGPLASTRKLCEDEVMAQERQFLAALASVATWDIARGMLDLHRADGARALTAKALER